MASSVAIVEMLNHALPASQPQDAHRAPGLLRRIFDRLIAARAAQARIEIARHRHLAKFDPDAPVLRDVFGR